MTNNIKLPVRLPAEWEYSGAILLSWPHAKTDWAYMLDEVQTCFIKIVEAISTYQKVIIAAPDIEIPQKQLTHIAKDKIFYFKTPTNDTWARDFGPITIQDANGTFHPLDFRFNGWGLKFPSCFDNCINRNAAACRLIYSPLIDNQDFVLEGGGIESDGNGSLMTTAYCQLSPNRNSHLTASEIKSQLINRLGGKQVLWLEYGYLAGDDTDSHIDTLARFAPDNTIVYVGCDNPDDEHFDELMAMKNELCRMRTLDHKPYNLIELPLPDPIYDDDGQRLPATYANFLALPQAVIMPVYNQPQKDRLASMIISVAYNRPVIEVDCRALIKQHGSLHCVTMQIPQSVLSI
ncbi:MAG: agmatine deiminase family protein [Paramuribaculum sp.]|nr:agmatine deiminase family protein [Paramuribaculum sp.]